MTIERDKSSVTITGASPGLIGLLRRAAVVAAEHEHNWIGVEDVLAAIVTATPLSILDVHWPRENSTSLSRTGVNDLDPSAPQQALTLDELKALVQSIVPGASNNSHGPAEPAAVAYEITGPHAEEFRAGIERSV
ncbi:hypothetical protein V7968_16405 [Nocardia vulneris]|uniref:hypothetical protein n=1 Tax=Nocardia vulneris TaxID=1141657 RepID=UPI0030CC7650